MILQDLPKKLGILATQRRVYVDYQCMNTPMINIRVCNNEYAVVGEVRAYTNKNEVSLEAYMTDHTYLDRKKYDLTIQNAGKIESIMNSIPTYLSDQTAHLCWVSPTLLTKDRNRSLGRVVEFLIGQLIYTNVNNFVVEAYKDNVVVVRYIPRGSKNAINVIIKYESDKLNCRILTETGSTDLQLKNIKQESLEELIIKLGL